MKSLHDAMLDPELFGKTFGGPTFENWRTVAKILEGLYETDIADASQQAREFIVREHSWQKAGRLLRENMFR